MDEVIEGELRTELSDAIRVLVVDDESSVRHVLRLTIGAEPAFSIVAEAAGGREAVALARHCQPDRSSSTWPCPASASRRFV